MHITGEKWPLHELNIANDRLAVFLALVPHEQLIALAPRLSKPPPGLQDRIMRQPKGAPLDPVSLPAQIELLELSQTPGLPPSIAGLQSKRIVGRELAAR